MDAAKWLERIKAASTAQQSQAPAQQEPRPVTKPRHALKERTFQEVDDTDVDYDFQTPNQFFGARINLIPLQSAVQGTRNFYGARFANQALPLVNREAPLVQNLADDDPEGRSFDDIFGEHAGAVKAKEGGTVEKVTPDEIRLKTPEGKKSYDLYNRFPFNQKTSISNTPRVKEGDEVAPGQLLASSNYTDDKGTLALGVNARTAVVPYKGQSMDDAIVVSESFANRMTSDHLYGYENEYKGGIKGGKHHFQGLFPEKFTNDQLERLDKDGIIQPGQKVNPGDPLILATKPRVISSTNKQLGLLSKHMKNARTDASTVWDHDSPGEVIDVERTKNGVKVNVSTVQPSQEGDKVAYRSGAKGVISNVIPDEQMPRTEDGKPLEVLLNPLSVPSRTNSSLIFELLLGKAAKKLGRPFKLPAFNKPSEKWYETVKSALDEAGLSSEERVFDPQAGKYLENPVLVGDGHMLKLHHQGSGKLSARAQGAYTSDFQPLHGGGEAGQSKRLSGLETHSLLSSGAYNVLREGSTLRGQRNDSYWRRLREGQDPEEPGSPFVWDKFMSMLNGAGYQARRLGNDGRRRLTFFTDKDLDSHDPMEIKKGQMLDSRTMEPVEGGLFDPRMTSIGKWGKVPLDRPMPNPAGEKVIKKLLGLTDKEYRAILAGEQELPERLR